MEESKKPLWVPSKEQVKNSNLYNYMKFLKEEYNVAFNDYDRLYSWSIDEIEKFWESIWKYSKIIHSRTYDSVLQSNSMIDSKWFLNAELNFAENLLRYSDDRIAIISSREDKPDVKLTYEQLYLLVAACASGLRKLGVKKGDRVAGYVTNIPETIIAMLAVTSIGAIWSSCSPDFGIQGVFDRFSQIKPRILFAIESYSYNGKLIDCSEKIDRIIERIPDIERVIKIHKFDNLILPENVKGNVGIDESKILYFNDLLKFNSSNISFERCSFDHPVYIMYSSGTTGLPKCIIHGAGGTLLQHFKEHVLHTNLSRNDVITYYTTCGWMMWNWLASALQVGATIFLYDGNPAYPDIGTLWEKIERNKITVFGSSPKFLSLCQKKKLVPKEEFDLQELDVILSTGSPLTKENFNWIYENVKEDLQLSSISGGTDIISCFMLGNPILPVYSEEIQCRGLGMKVEAFDDKGQPQICEKGELACTKPFPSMPVYFWNDQDGTKYRKAYFEKFDGVWAHGDYIKITENGGVIVYGRSDAILNPGGIRIGTAEIYRIVESMDEISESLVIGKKWNGDVRVILFIVLTEGIRLTGNLVDKIKEKIRLDATPRHVPAKIYQVDEIPHTISGKKVEIAVNRILNGEEIENRDSLANPGSLDQFYKYR